MDELPARYSILGSFSRSLYNRECHIAFYKNGSLKVYSYSKDNLPISFVKLLQILRMEHWNF